MCDINAAVLHKYNTLDTLKIWQKMSLIFGNISNKIRPQ
jgi:hypothetical protein